MSRSLFVLAVLLVAAPVRAADTYPAFRGDGNGRIDAKGLPLEWTPKSLAWTTKLPGYGQSSPVVWKGRVFVTAIEGPMKETNLILAYDSATGKQVWRKDLPATQKVKANFSVARAAPTPVVDADGLYVFFESGELAKLTHDGKEVWLRSLVKEYGEFKNGHQLGTSPAQSADTLYVLIDHQGPSYLLAVDKKTGKNRWKVDRSSRSSWTSPVVLRQNDRERIVVSSGGSVDVYDTAGKMLSTYTDVGNNNVPSATVQDGVVVVGASDPQRNPNREVSLKSCCCLTIDADGKLSEKPLWHSEKATASFASPLLYRDCVYYLNTVGVLACLDAKTGKEHYSERTQGGCWASPVAVGDRIYLFGRNGTTTVIKAGAKFEKLATNRLWDGTAPAAPRPGADPMAARFGDPILYGVAVVDGAIFARTGTELFAIKGK